MSKNIWCSMHLGNGNFVSDFLGHIFWATIKFKWYQNTSGCGTAYNWSFKHLKGSDLTLTLNQQKWTIKLLLKNSRIHKHRNFKNPPPTSLLCGHHQCHAHGKYVTQKKDGSSFINFLKFLKVAVIFIFIKQQTFLGNNFPPDFSGRVFWFSCFSFFILFLIPSVYITGDLCSLSIFSGRITSLVWP